MQPSFQTSYLPQSAALATSVVPKKDLPAHSRESFPTSVSMAGGQSEEPGDRTWQVNPDAGTLQGWGAFSSPVEAAPVQPHVHYDVAKTPGDEEGDDVVDACKLQAPRPC